MMYKLIIHSLNLGYVGCFMTSLSIDWYLQLDSYKRRTEFRPIVPSIKFIPIGPAGRVFSPLGAVPREPLESEILNATR